MLYRQASAAISLHIHVGLFISSVGDLSTASLLQKEMQGLADTTVLGYINVLCIRHLFLVLAFFFSFRLGLSAVRGGIERFPDFTCRDFRSTHICETPEGVTTKPTEQVCYLTSYCLHVFILYTPLCDLVLRTTLRSATMPDKFEQRVYDDCCFVCGWIITVTKMLSPVMILEMGKVWSR